MSLGPTSMCTGRELAPLPHGRHIQAQSSMGGGPPAYFGPPISCLFSKRGHEVYKDLNRHGAEDCHPSEGSGSGAKMGSISHALRYSRPSRLLRIGRRTWRGVPFIEFDRHLYYRMKRAKAGIEIIGSTLRWSGT